MSANMKGSKEGFSEKGKKNLNISRNGSDMIKKGASKNVGMDKMLAKKMPFDKKKIKVK